MKNNKLLYALSIGALAVAVGSLIICLLLISKQDHLIKKIDEISGQIVQLATVTESDKAQWAENVTPGFNHFHSAAFGHFDYPAEWGEPYAKRISFANGIYGGTKWTLSFNGLGPMGDWVQMEAYWHDPSVNVYYPFDTNFDQANISLVASAAFTQGNSASQACNAYKKLHSLMAECQKFTDSIFFINDDENSEIVWFVTSPTRTDTTQQADYPGVVIHASDGHDAQVRALLNSLQPQGTWTIDELKVKDVQ